MSSYKIEIEAKFTIPDPLTFLALQKLTQLDDFELKPLDTKTVIDRYLDTADQSLYQAGLACRLRNIKNRQMITLKSLTPAKGDLHRRKEIETEVGTDPWQADQPRTWAKSKVKKLVVEITGSAPLQTWFTLYQTRHQFHVLWQDQPVIEFSLDEVSLRDPTVVDYRELEAELIGQGVEANLTLFVEALQARWPLQAETQSKFERALAVSTLGSNLEYSVRETIGLKPTDTLAEAGRKVLGFHFARMLQHEPGTRAGHDIEALHDMRVAIRRMRAAFRVFETGFSKKTIKPLLAGLKATGRALGRVRDLDVFMQKLQDYQQSLPADEQSVLQPLLDTWHTEREQARQEMLAYLDSKKYLKFRQDFLEFVTTKGLGAKPTPDGGPALYQLRHLLPGLIYERYEAVHAYEIVLDNAALDTLHQLRITLKQLRYALEYFEEILGKERKMVIEEVKILQDHLGELNDAHVASELLRDFLVNWDQNQLHLPLAERQSPTHLVAYLNAKLKERHHLIATFPQAWARFNRPKFRRNLALSLAVL